MSAADDVRHADHPLERDLFMRRLLRELAGVLQDVVGEAEASGYVSVVGAAMGEQLDKDYRRGLSVERLSREQVAAVLVDLKRRIEGRFRVVEETPERIVFQAEVCPFGEFVHGRPSLCMMTSNVFGHIAAQNLGYADVDLEETIARGAPGCRVVLRLRPDDRSVSGRQYFRRDAPTAP